MSVQRYLIYSMLWLVAATANAGTAITLSPSGDTTGAADAAALQNAVDSTGAEGDIRLSAGHYYLGRSILMQDFNGRIRGAGMDSTRLSIAAEIPVTTACPFWSHAPSRAAPWPFLFEIVNGNVKISDLAMDAPLAIPARFAYSDCDAVEGPTVFPVLGAFIGIFSSDGAAGQQSTIERVRLTGGSGLLAGFNVVQLTYHEGLIGSHYLIDNDFMGIPLDGMHSIRDSYFENGIVGNSLSNLASSASVMVSSNQYRHLIEGFESLDVNGRVAFNGNTVSDSLGVGILAADGYFHATAGLPLNQSTTLTIFDNRFEIANAFAALDLEDWANLSEGVPLLDVSARQNEIVLTDSNYGIAGYGLRDARLSNNRLSGHALADGIQVGTYAPSTGCLFIQNDVDELQADRAPVHLGPFTASCTVVMPQVASNVRDDTDDPSTAAYDGTNKLLNSQ